jgi:4-hydroxy-tetrahydrodipicolinate reductase
MDRVHLQLKQCIAKSVHVVSSTEELSFPYDRHPELSVELDALAKEQGVVVVGTGVNPGFAMDTMALLSTGVCSEVTEVHVRRVVDAGKRRLPLQRKVGAGISVTEFEEKKKTGTFGHIGLRESLLFVASGLGWPLDRIEETLDAVIADQQVVTNFVTIQSGHVAGIHHAVQGYAGGKAILTLDLKMYVGAVDPHDGVRVLGSPPIDLMVHGGIFGDTATVAALVNAVPLVMKAQPGLKTMMDLPVPRAFATTPLSRKKAHAA